MPRIKPTSVQDLLRFIEDHRSDIENGMYDIQIQDEWVPHIPETSVRFLVKHCTSSHGSFSRHPKSHLDVLSILARDKSESVRSLVARNPSTPIEVLALLSRDKGEEVRNSVAINPRATPDVLSILAKDTGIIKIQGTKYEIVPIRAAVARHPNTPPEILEILAVDADYSVRCAVAANPHTPVQQLLNLAGDVHETGISSNPRISEVLGNLAKDDWANRRWVAACSPYSPISMLKSFAKDHKYSVRIRVVRNP